MRAAIRRPARRPAPPGTRCETGGTGGGSAAKILAVLLLAASLAACDKPAAYGEANSLIVAAADSLWSQAADTTYAALERTVRSVRNEKRYRATYTDPAAEEWSQLRQWRQVVVFGTADDPVVEEALRSAGRRDAAAPEIVLTESVWARGQLVTVVLLDPDDPVGSWISQLDSVYETVDERYRDWVQRRMFVSGRDSALADSLVRRFGFRIAVPRVYERRVAPDDGVVVFRNDNPSPGELIRSVAVAWRAERLDTLTAEAVYEWRNAIDSVHYGTAQAVNPDTLGPPRPFEHAGHPALAVRGTWEDEGPYPAGGPFVSWLVQCPERTFLVDGWIYAPGKDAYQYLLQIGYIMESFRCGEPPAGATDG